MKRLLIALGGASLASFLAVGIALAGEPVGGDLERALADQQMCGTCHDDGGAPSGDADGGDVEQRADQDNDTDQDADAEANAIQVGGANVAVNVLSHGDTEQANSNQNSADAENSNETVQAIGQDQDARGGDATSGDATIWGRQAA